VILQQALTKKNNCMLKQLLCLPTSGISDSNSLCRRDRRIAGTTWSRESIRIRGGCQAWTPRNSGTSHIECTPTHPLTKPCQREACVSRTFTSFQSRNATRKKRSRCL